MNTVTAITRQLSFDDIQDKKRKREKDMSKY